MMAVAVEDVAELPGFLKFLQRLPEVGSANAAPPEERTDSLAPLRPLVEETTNGNGAINITYYAGLFRSTVAVTPRDGVALHVLQAALSRGVPNWVRQQNGRLAGHQSRSTAAPVRRPTASPAPPRASQSAAKPLHRAPVSGAAQPHLPRRRRSVPPSVRDVETLQALCDLAPAHRGRQFILEGYRRQLHRQFGPSTDHRICSLSARGWLTSIRYGVGRVTLPRSFIPKAAKRTRRPSPVAARPQPRSSRPQSLDAAIRALERFLVDELTVTELLRRLNRHVRPRGWTVALSPDLRTIALHRR